MGRTREHFDNLRRGIGERAWTALYQGSPVSPEGGLILREWIDSHRLPSQPVRPLRTIVAIDLSDSGTGDHCGLIATNLARDAAGKAQVVGATSPGTITALSHVPTPSTTTATPTH